MSKRPKHQYHLTRGEKIPRIEPGERAGLNCELCNSETGEKYEGNPICVNFDKFYVFWNIYLGGKAKILFLKDSGNGVEFDDALGPFEHVVSINIERKKGGRLYLIYLVWSRDHYDCGVMDMHGNLLKNFISNNKTTNFIYTPAEDHFIVERVGWYGNCDYQFYDLNMKPIGESYMNLRMDVMDDHDALVQYGVANRYTFSVLDKNLNPIYENLSVDKFDWYCKMMRNIEDTHTKSNIDTGWKIEDGDWD